MHPYLDGLNDPRNRILKASCFNSRKLSPVFTGGPGIDEVPAIWVDRAGIKANITEVSALGIIKGFLELNSHAILLLLTSSEYSVLFRTSIGKANSHMG